MQISKRISKRKFSNIIQMGEEISKVSKDGVRDLIKIFGRSYLYRHLTISPQHSRHGGKVPHVECRYQLLDINTKIVSGRTYESFGEKLSPSRPLNLGKDLVFPWPWERNRYIRSISNIGESRYWGVWREDRNHRIEYWEPMGIGWVHGGNHSIMAGIINGEGEVNDYVRYDYSALYQEVSCDGVSFYNKRGDAIQGVLQPEFAVIYELGRFLLEEKK